MARMPLRTRLLTTALDRLVPQITEMDLAQIERSRRVTYPRRGPAAWIMGRVPDHVRISDTWFATRDGSSRQARVYQPVGLGPHPVIVYFHGGGFVLGSPRQHDPICAQLAARTPALVVSIDYRMGPEHRAPTAVHDAEDGLAWAARSAAQFGGDGERIAVAGDSAGGNLAALVCHWALDHGGPRISHQALLYPGVDLSCSFPSVREHSEAPLLSAAKIAAFLDHYLQPGADRRDPTVSPYWRRDLRGLPPALIQTADLDPLRDEGQAYAARLAAAGVAVRATNYLGAVHGFASIPGATLIGAQAMWELVTELSMHLSAGSPGSVPDSPPATASGPELP